MTGYEINTDGIIKIGKCEHTMFTSGDVFCSLNKEELEQEREAARESYEKFQELLLLEESSKMTMMDFYKRWNKWNDRKSDESYRERLERNRMDTRVAWDRYKYQRETYDREQADAAKMNRWRKFHMIQDHIWIVACIVISYLAWNDITWRFWSYFFGIIAFFNIIMIGYRWTTYRRTNEWEVL